MICPNRRDRHCSGAGVTEGDGYGHWRTTVRCYYCRRTLPLGPSVDNRPAVQVEIRSAEIAANITTVVGRRSSTSNEKTFLSEPVIGCDGAEISGWVIATYDSDKAPEQAGEHSGYLARIIYEHDRNAP